MRAVAPPPNKPRPSQGTPSNPKHRRATSHPQHLVSDVWHCGRCGIVVLRGVRWPPDPSRGGRRPPTHRPQPRESFGTGCRPVTHNRTVAGLPVAWTRQVTVTALICGVDVSSTHLDAKIGAKIGHENGAFRRFERTTEGIAALAAFCHHHAASLVVMEATGGYEQLAVGQLWAAQYRSPSSTRARSAALPKAWA